MQTVGWTDGRTDQSPTTTQDRSAPPDGHSHGPLCSQLPALVQAETQDPEEGTAGPRVPRACRPRITAAGHET